MVLPVSQSPDLIGRTLARTYHVEELLGRGGMGAVYRVRHLRTGGSLAVKVLHREAAADPEIYKRFQDEARAASALRHPNIIQITDFDQEVDGTPFMVMELLEGEDLHRRLKIMGRLPLQVVLEMARQIASALQAAHEHGVIHRDIKPQNIFLARHRVGGDFVEVVKVVDFGVSKIRHGESQITKEQTILGTPHFMSPEVARGQNQGLDGRADQFSLAVILYRALAGQLPFDAVDMMAVLYQVVHERPIPITQLVPGLPLHVVGAIEKALSKEPQFRFPDMNAFVFALTGQPMSGAHSHILTTPSRPYPPLRGRSVPGLAPALGLHTQGAQGDELGTTLSSATGHRVAPRRRRMVWGGIGAALLLVGAFALGFRSVWIKSNGNSIGSAQPTLIPETLPADMHPIDQASRVDPKLDVNADIQPDTKPEGKAEIPKMESGKRRVSPKFRRPPPAQDPRRPKLDPGL